MFLEISICFWFLTGRPFSHPLTTLNLSEFFRRCPQTITPSLPSPIEHACPQINPLSYHLSCCHRPGKYLAL